MSLLQFDESSCPHNCEGHIPSAKTVCWEPDPRLQTYKVAHTKYPVNPRIYPNLGLAGASGNNSNGSNDNPDSFACWFMVQ